MRHMTYSLFCTPTCWGVGHICSLPCVLPDSWDEMCKSETRICEKMLEKRAGLLSVRWRVHGGVSPDALCWLRPPFSISDVYFVPFPASRHHPRAPAGVSRPGIHATAQPTTPGGILFDGMLPSCREALLFLTGRGNLWILSVMILTSGSGAI